MKPYKSLLLCGILGAQLHANSLLNPEFDQEFQKLHNMFNSMVQHVNSKEVMNKYDNFLSYNTTNVNIYKKNKTYNIEYQLAGIDKKDIQLKLLENNILELKVEKKQKKEDTSKEYHTKQISYNFIQKSIQLPEDVDTKKMDVKYENGILYVQMPIIEEPKIKGKIIPIK